MIYLPFGLLQRGQSVVALHARLADAKDGDGREGAADHERPDVQPLRRIRIKTVTVIGKLHELQ